MRYFIYKDCEISGPFAPQELAESGGLPCDALVCEEGFSGRRDSDWLPASEVAELSGIRKAPSAATAVLDEPPGTQETGGFERLEFDPFGSPVAGEGETWLVDLFDDEQFSRRWGDLIPKPLEDTEDSSRARIADLTGQLAVLKSRLSELESLKAATSAPPMPAFQPPPPQPLLSAPLPVAGADIELPPIKLGAAKPAAPGADNARTDFQKEGEQFVFKGKPRAPSQSGARPIRFAPSQSFRVVEKESHPAELPVASQPPGSGTGGAPPAYEWASQTPAAPATGLPQAGSAAALPETQKENPGLSLPPAAGLPSAGSAPAFPEAPPETADSLLSPSPAKPPAPVPDLSQPVASAPDKNMSPPTPAPAQYIPPQTVTPAPSLNPANISPPITMMFGAPVSAPPAAGPGFPQAMPPLEPPPVPQMPGLGSPSSGALTPSRANAGVITPTAEAAQDVVARLAKPAAASGTDAKPKRRRSLAGPIMSFLVILLTGLAVVFLYKRPKDLKTMASMDADQKPMGSEVEEEPQAPPSADKPAPTTVSSGPTETQPAEAPPPAGRDMIPDAGEAAVALVKNYPLAGDRSSVGQWLSYSYNADGSNKEDWSAGAVDATTYAVEYKVQPGPNSARKEVISLLFEADTARRIVQGKNTEAQRLLAGGEAVKSKKAAKPIYRRRARKARLPATPKTVPLAPLPADSELLPPAEDDASFKTDTIEPGL